MNSDELFSVIEQVAQSGSRDHKRDILAPLISEHPFVAKVFRYAYDPMITFGLTAPAAKTKGKEAFDGSTDWLWSLLDDLSNRKLTGNAAKDSVVAAYGRLSVSSATLLKRILDKDLRCGVATSTINMIAPGTVPVFGCMLAHKYEEKRITNFPVGVEPKLDGLRTICLVNQGRARFFSRTGKPFPALDHLAPAVIDMVRGAWESSDRIRKDISLPEMSRLHSIYHRMLGYMEPSLALDAEVVSGAFNKTTGDVRRKDEIASDAVLNIFDVIPYHVMTGEFVEWGVPFRARREFLHFIVKHASVGSSIRITPLDLLYTHAEITSAYLRHRENGLEGAMVKPLDGIYRKKRSHAWLKMKAEETEDLRVIGVFEGTGKYEGMLGGLIVDRNGVAVRVGGGFSDDQRKEIWSDHKADLDNGGNDHWTPRVVGRLIEIEFHEVTPDGSLRHPRFIAWRDDKDEQVAA